MFTLRLKFSKASQDAYACRMGFVGQLPGSYIRTPTSRSAGRTCVARYIATVRRRRRPFNVIARIMRRRPVRQAMSLHGWLDAGCGELPRAPSASRPRPNRSIPSASCSSCPTAAATLAVSGCDRRQSQPADDGRREEGDGWMAT